MSTTEFVSVPNMRRLMAVLDSHFSENLGIDLAGLGVPMKQFLHKVMKNVKKDYGKTHDIHDMNKVAVKIAKDFLMQVAKSQYESQQFNKKFDLVAPMHPPPDRDAPVDPVVEKPETGEEMSERIKRFEEERERMVLEPAADVALPSVHRISPSRWTSIGTRMLTTLARSRRRSRRTGRRCASSTLTPPTSSTRTATGAVAGRGAHSRPRGPIPTRS